MRDLSQKSICEENLAIKAEGESLRTLVYASEGILSFSVIASIAMLIRTKKIYSRNTNPDKSQILSVSASVTPQWDYLWQVREAALRSCVGYSALLVGMLNFAWSIYFVYRYMKFVYLVEDNDFDS